MEILIILFIGAVLFFLCNFLIDTYKINWMEVSENLRLFYLNMSAYDGCHNRYESCLDRKNWWLKELENPKTRTSKEIKKQIENYIIR